MQSTQRIACVIPLLLFGSSIASAGSRAKTDIVYMKNGDRITCEVKRLEYGQLSVKPDYVLDTVVLDWSKVDHIESSQVFSVLMQNGTQYTGKLVADSAIGGVLTIRAETDTRVANRHVAAISQLGPSFLKRLKGNIDIGLTVQGSDSQENLAIDSGLSYQSDKHVFTLDVNSQYSSQKETNNTRQQTLSTGLYSRIRETNWYQGGL